MTMVARATAARSTVTGWDELDSGDRFGPGCGPVDASGPRRMIRVWWRRWRRWSTDTRDPSRRCVGRASRRGRWPRSCASRATGSASSPVRRLLHRGRVQPAGQRQDRSRATQHPDRDAQFRYLNDQVQEHLAAGSPVISVDTKKKELVGEYKNGGREWRPSGQPERVNVHDFPGQQLGKAIPYGVYDLAAEHRLGVASAPTTTPPRSRWPPSAAGGRRSAPTAYPARRPAVDHRRRAAAPTATAPGCGRRTGRAGRRDRPGHHRLPLPARHLEMEQDRAPAVHPHHHRTGAAGP